MPNQIELKPCPFCGGRGRIMRAGNDAYVVRCKECGAQTARSFIKDWHRIKYIAQGKAAEAWNHRADTRNESQAVLDDGAFGACPNCEYEFNSELRNEYEIRYCPNCGQKLDWRIDNGNGMDQR